MTYRFVDHTAELQLELEGPTRAAVLGDAVLALAELIGVDVPGAPRERSREITLRAADDATLLAAWLDELVFVAETEGLVPCGVESIDAGPGRVDAVVAFVEAEPRQLVKGATYHDLRLEVGEHGWSGRVVLDV